MKNPKEQKLYCVALTGNIASGKSTVANEFAKLGIELISADQIAKELTAKDTPAFRQIVNHFGLTILAENGELNRRQLREVVFADAKQRLWLEQLLHPLIRQQIAQKISLMHGPYCLIEIPLLVNKADYPYLNRVLLVTADPEQQLARIMDRDQCNKGEALAILATQAKESSHREIADDILSNTQNFEAMKSQVTLLHQKYLNLAARSSR